MARRLALLLAVALLATACSGLEFVQDRRLSFTSPRSNHLTKLPVTLAWSMKNFTTAGADGGEFAVFIDKSPMKVGQTLSSLLPSGTKPSKDLLANIRVYVTRSTSVTIDLIPDISSNHGTRQRHTATVVLLNAAGKRTTESSWSRDFDLKKAGS